MGEVSISWPEYGKGMTVNRGGAFCDDCGLKVWRRVAGKTLSDGELKALVEKGEVRVSGPRFRKGKIFFAVLVLEDGDVKFRFPKRN